MSRFDDLRLPARFILEVLRREDPPELPWELQVLGHLVAGGQDTPDLCVRCAADRPEPGHTRCAPCLGRLSGTVAAAAH